MNKIPMQIYLDQDTVLLYKQYASAQGKSFAQVIREVVKEKKVDISKLKLIPKAKKKKDLYQFFVKDIKKLQTKFKKAPYYYPELSDDELLYGK